MDDVPVRIPSLNAWDQFVWPPTAAVLQAITQVEQYGYHWGHAVDLGPVMPASQFKVTDEAGTYLCTAWVLVFKGSVLAYNPARDEAEWVPACGITNDLSWVEERTPMVLVNYVPCIPQEVACIAALGTRHLASWPDDSSSEEEDDDQTEEEDDEWEEEDPVDVEEQGEVSLEPSPGSTGTEQGETREEAKPQG